MAEDLPSARTIGIIAKPISIKLAQTVGLTAAAFLAGQTASTTYLVLPALLRSPAPLLARQFQTLRAADARTALPSAAALAALFAWLAAREPAISTRAFRAYALAAALYPAALAYTALVVGPTADAISAGAHGALHGASDGQESASTVLVGGADSPTSASPASSVRGGEGVAERSSLREFVTSRVGVQEMNTHQLVDRWGWLNLGRAALGVGAAVAAAWAVASEDLSFFELF